MGTILDGRLGRQAIPGRRERARRAADGDDGRGRGWANAIGAHVIPWAVPLLVIGLWQALSQSGVISERFLPAPLAVARAGWELAADGRLWENVAASARRAALGFLVGGSIGFALGLLNGAFRWSARLLDSTVQMVRNIPHLAMIPLVILWFGIGEEARVFLVAVGVAFPIYINTFHGVRNVDAGLVEMGRSYGLSTWQRFRQVILPGALPSILVGVRYALGIMWLTLIVAETIAAQEGIGYITMNAREFLQTDVLVFGIVLYALLGKLADSLARGLERVLLAWHPSYAAK